MPHLYKKIPKILKERPNWVVWGIPGEPPKAPFNPVSLLSGNPKPAKANIRETWSRYESAVDCVNCKLAQGIGFEFEGNDLYGVDLDHVINEQGVLMPEAKSIVDRLDSYTEISPSGKGLHIFVFAPDADITRHRKKDFFLEIYNPGRYFTVTGNSLGAVKPINTRTEQLQFIHDKFLLPDPARRTNAVQLTHIVAGIPTEKFLHIGLERDKVFAALWAGQRRHGNESSDDIALMNKLAYWCNGNPEVMVQAFLSSPYFLQKDEAHTKKCRRTDYLPRTAENSRSTAYSTAAADYEQYKNKQNMKRSYAR